MHFWLRLINYQTYHIWVFYKMDPVFFIKSTKIGVFYQYGYIDITKNRDPCPALSLEYLIQLMRWMVHIGNIDHRFSSDSSPTWRSPLLWSGQVVSCWMSRGGISMFSTCGGGSLWSNTILARNLFIQLWHNTNITFLPPVVFHTWNILFCRFGCGEFLCKLWPTKLCRIRSNPLFRNWHGRWPKVQI